MTKTKILATSLCALLAAACSNDQTHGPATTTPTPVSKTPTAGAARVHGDLVPGQLLAMNIPKPTELALLHGSDALAINKEFAVETPAEPVVGHDFRRVVMKRDATQLTFPVDAPAGAMVLVRSLDGSPLTSVHMHSVATGKRLDHARDSQNSEQVGRPGSPLREPGFTPLLDSRQLSFDEPMTTGLVQIDLPAGAAPGGIVFEVQQPNSPVTLSATPGELTYANGETADLTFTLADTGAPLPLDGATVSAWAELPDHSRSPALAVSPLGGGRYVAHIPLSGADHLGTWGIHVTATGTSHGVAFERGVETAFAYYPAHARMVDVGTPQVQRGPDKLIDEVSVDVDIESLADDRFSVRGTLTYTGEDGHEHPLASAQTGQTVNAGTSTITLHFAADSLALANVSGPFHVRDLALVSQAYGITQHRIGLGLNLATAAIRADEIRFPKTISIQAQDLIANGDLPQPRQR